MSTEKKAGRWIAAILVVVLLLIGLVGSRLELAKRFDAVMSFLQRTNHSDEKVEAKSPKWTVSVQGKKYPIHIAVDSNWEVEVGFGCTMGQMEFGVDVPIFTISLKNGPVLKVASLDPQFNAQFKQNYLTRGWNSKDGFSQSLGVSFGFGGLVVEVGQGGPMNNPVTDNLGTLSRMNFQNRKITIEPLSPLDQTFPRVLLDPRIESAGFPHLGHPLLGESVNSAVYEMRMNNHIKWTDSVIFSDSLSRRLILSKVISDETAFVGTAGALVKEFADSEEFAALKYVGRKVRIDGRPSPFGVHPIGVFYLNPSLTISGDASDSLLYIDCEFDRDQNEAIDKLKDNDHVVIEGRCMGKSLGRISVVSCRIVE